ncbi:MAG: hypothetical protein ABGW87_14170 [Sphingomonadaceae bacterium]
MFTQLNPTIPVHVLGKGDGFAVGVIDYGQEHNLLWVTAINGSGEIWCAPNPEVRMQANWSMGRSQNVAAKISKKDLANEPSLA